MAEYTPGYVDVPGKGKRYRNAQGEYFHNHFGSIFNSFKKAKDRVGDAYNNYYDGVADAAGTERRDGTVRTAPVTTQSVKTQKPAAPPKAVVNSNGSNGARGGNRSGVTPVNGSFRTAVEQVPNGNVTPSSGNAGGGTPQPQLQTKDQRVNANGLVSYGRDLSSLNTFTKEFTGGYEITDIKSAFQSEDLPGAYNGSNKIGYQQTPYELPEGATPSPLDKGLAGAQGLTMQDTGYTIGEASVPGTVGRSGSAQEGSSGKPDIAEEVRTIRMRRKGPRDDGGPRGFAIDRANEMAQNSVSETKGNGISDRRLQMRNAFLDTSKGSVQAVLAKNAIAGYGGDSDGNAVFNYGGKLVYAKEGMEQQAKDAASFDKDPTQFLDIPATPDTQPDSPAASEISMTAPIKDMNEKQQKQAAQEFAKGFVSDISSKLKKK